MSLQKKHKVLIVIGSLAIIGIGLTVTIVLINKNNSNTSKKGGGSNTGSVDTSGLTDYVITIPFKYQPKLFTNGQFDDAIKSVSHSFISITVKSDANKKPINILYEITASPSDLDKLKSILDGMKSEITISEKNKS